MENMKEKLSCDLWFSLPEIKVTLKQLSETVLKKFMSVQILVFKIASVAKLYSGIRKYFAKQQEICLFYFIAESRML